LALTRFINNPVDQASADKHLTRLGKKKKNREEKIGTYTFIFGIEDSLKKIGAKIGVNPI